jgi:hypothetical protein
MSRKTGRPSYSRAISRPAGQPRPWGQVISAVIGLLVALAVGVFIGVQVAGPSATESMEASFREQDARRDVTQIAELTTRARDTAKAVKPILDGMAPAADAAAVTDAQVAQWKQLIGKEVQAYSVTVSGMTATNVARGGLRNAVDQLAAAVDLYAAARTAAGSRQTLTQLAIRQRDLAVATWSVAATQLDQINIDAGNGHQHVYLDTTTQDGAMTGDGLPEGSKP